MALTPGVGEDPPKKYEAFTNRDYHQLHLAIEKLANTQLGIHAEPFNADQLAGLFCPPEHLVALRHVYKIESRDNASGIIYVDLMSVLPMDEPIFDERDAQCIPKKATLSIYFHRDSMQNGFITPKTVFGTGTAPLTTFTGMILEDREAFCNVASAMLRTAGEWAVVKWVLAKLQYSMRTPQQMRYVWPAIYQLAQLANLKMAADLAKSSLRSGINAVPDRECGGFIRPTYDIVANSALVGTKTEFINRYITGQLRLWNCEFEIMVPGGDAGTQWITINGI